MKVVEIAFTVYPVTDSNRARRFYEGTLGLTASRVFGNEKAGMIEYDIGPGTLAIGFGYPGFNPSAGGGCAALEVDDFDAAVNRLRQDGVKFVVEPTETPVCHLAIVADPDGNSVTVHKRKADALRGR
ncbi:MAG TPA: VOC family protein [Verrucomicrobiae bacterium]|nr:VOC family protein [Verrucomicrobiae bacterium]